MFEETKLVKLAYSEHSVFGHSLLPELIKNSSLHFCPGPGNRLIISLFYHFWEIKNFSEKMFITSITERQRVQFEKMKNPNLILFISEFHINRLDDDC